MQSSLEYANAAGTEIIQTAVPLINNTCMVIVKQCAEIEDADCPAYHKCSQVRDEIVNKIIMLKLAILDAETARAVGDSKSAEEAVTRAVSLIMEIRQHLQKVGML
jgi:hypothetical protein